MIAGWLAVTLAILSLVPSFVPGAASVIGLLMSLLALPLSLFSIRKRGSHYFRIVLGIVVIGMLLVNDSLRIWATHPIPIGVQAALVALACIIIGACVLVARKLAGSATLL